MFTLTPKHQKLVNACYITTKDPKEVKTDHQKVGLLIHHITLKPERVHKICKYLREKVKQEIKSQSIETTYTILIRMMDNFSLEEVPVVKIINTTIKHITRHTIKSYDKMLEIIKKFRGGMKSYDGEKEIRKTVLLVTNALNQCNNANDESDESSSIMKDTDMDHTSFFFDILILLLGIKELFNNDYEKQYINVMRAICKFENEKCLIALCYTVNIITVRTFCRVVVEMATKSGFDCINVVIGNMDWNFLMYMVVESHHCMVERIDDIRKIVDKENGEYLDEGGSHAKDRMYVEGSFVKRRDEEKKFEKMSMKSSDDLKIFENAKERFKIESCKDKIARFEEKDFKNTRNKSKLKNINKTDNDDVKSEITSDDCRNQINTSKNLDSDANSPESSNESATTPVNVNFICLNQFNQPHNQKKIINMPRILIEVEQDFKDIFLLFKWNYIIIEFIATNKCVLEISQTFFEILKSLYEQNKRIKKDDIKDMDLVFRNTTISSKKCFVIQYLQTYLFKSVSALDIIFLFIKKTFRHEYANKNEIITIYSVEFQKVILDITHRHIKQKGLTIDPKFIALIFKISENIYWRNSCYKILNDSVLDDPHQEDRRAILLKLRALYFDNHNIILLSLIFKMLDTNIKDRDLTISIMVDVAKNNGHIEIVRNYCIENNIMPFFETCMEKKLLYKPDDDFAFYDDIMGANRRFYCHSLKSTINLNGMASKRRTSLSRIKFFE